MYNHYSLKKQFLGILEKAKCHDMGLDFILWLCIFLKLQKEERYQSGHGGGASCYKANIHTEDGQQKQSHLHHHGTWMSTEGGLFIPSVLGPKGTERPGGSMEVCKELHSEKT